MDCTEYLRRENHALKDMVKKGQNRALQGTVENTEKKFKETIYDFIQI